MGADQDRDEGGLTMDYGKWQMKGMGQSKPLPSQTQVGTGYLAEKQGLSNLLSMLQQQGQMDPRLMASLQAANARSTQQQQDAVRGRGSATGMAGSGLMAALQASVGAAGANRASNITMQDISDAYGRNQQNIGLMNQVVQQPALGYANLKQQQDQFNQQMKAQKRAATFGFVGSLLGSAGTYAGTR